MTSLKNYKLRMTTSTSNVPVTHTEQSFSLITNSPSFSLITNSSTVCRMQNLNRNLSFSAELLLVVHRGAPPPTTATRPGHLIWSDMARQRDPATKTHAGETCSFKCCISLGHSLMTACAGAAGIHVGMAIVLKGAAKGDLQSQL